MASDEERVEQNFITNASKSDWMLVKSAPWRLVVSCYHLNQAARYDGCQWSSVFTPPPHVKGRPLVPSPNQAVTRP